MIDASGEPFEKNVAITKRVVDAAHAKGIVVEAELGQLGGVEEHVAVDEANAKLTDPEPGQGICRTLRLRLAGLSPSAPATEPSNSAVSQGLHFEVLEEIQKRLPGFPLVMHGSCSVPQEEVARINAAGGNLKRRQGCG